MKEELIKKLTELNNQLEDLDNTIETSMNEYKSTIIINVSNRLDQCEWKMKKLARSVDNGSSSSITISKKGMKLKLGF